jgi:hypothetical protein
MYWETFLELNYRKNRAGAGAETGEEDVMSYRVDLSEFMIFLLLQTYKPWSESHEGGYKAFMLAHAQDLLLLARDPWKGLNAEPGTVP